MKKVELLSPAGDLERLKVTLLYGADAVYIGGQEYSLRANATNFSIDEIIGEFYNELLTQKKAIENTKASFGRGIYFFWNFWKIWNECPQSLVFPGFSPFQFPSNSIPFLYV